MDGSILGALIGGILATVGGLLGGIVTGWYTLRANRQSLEHAAQREERERGLAFRREQLSDFYGPVLACMEELEECWQLLFEADKNVEQFLRKQRDAGNTNEMVLDKQKAVLEYKQYLYGREVTVFNKIKDIFISHFGLAEPSTKENYRTVVRFIENRNIITVTERKLDISFTGEDASGLRDRLGSLFQNLSDINTQIRVQLETGEPKPITQFVNNEPAPKPSSPGEPEKESASPLTAPVSARTRRQTLSDALVVHSATLTDELLKPTQPLSQDQKNSERQNWPGRYTLLTNKRDLETEQAEYERKKKEQ